MRATVALPSLVFTVLLGGLWGCAEKSVGPVRILPADPLPALIVSEPLRMPANGSVRANTSGAFATASPSLVYLSLPPGSATDGVEATIRNQASNAIAKAAFVNGGFDPVALGAKVGDTLVVDVVTRNPNQPIRAMRVAGADRPPVVVRTNPPAAQPDVPLNSIVLVVFSVPVDSASLSGGSVQLWRDTVRVAGRVQFSDSTQIKAEFHPDAPLASATTYRLIIGQTVADVNGLRLASPVTVTFSTVGTGPSLGALAFVGLSAGASYTCGVTAGSAAYCWGDNSSGTLGNGTKISSPAPVLVAGVVPFATIVAGWSHTCALTAAGEAFCWGSNEAGQLGDSTTLERTTPVRVAGGHRFYSVSVGGTHTCGTTAETILDAAVTYCWGSNASGQLGDGTSTGRIVPTVVPRVYGQFMSVGRNHTCTVDSWNTGEGWCWGANDKGQLGDGSTSSRGAPANMIMIACGPPGAQCPYGAIAAGGSHTCAEVTGLLFRTYAWYCWGANANGQLGDGTTLDRTGPASVGGGLPFAVGGVSAGGRHSCGVTSAGAAYCWGLNSSGQVGDGTTVQRTSPVLVSGRIAFGRVSAGKDGHSCGVTARGEAYCWGANNAGQLGNGTTVGSTVPAGVVIPQ